MQWCSISKNKFAQMGWDPESLSIDAYRGMWQFEQCQKGFIIITAPQNLLTPNYEPVLHLLPNPMMQKELPMNGFDPNKLSGGRCETNQSLTSATPSAEIWNRASASGKQGELITLQMRSSPLPFRRASLIQRQVNRLHLRSEDRIVDYWFQILRMCKQRRI